MDYLGPPILAFPPTGAIDLNPSANTVVEGAAANSSVGILAFSTSLFGLVTYSLSADNSSGGFKINPLTGVVTVNDPSKINFETAPGHAYTITVQSTDIFGFSSTAEFYDQRH